MSRERRRRSICPARQVVLRVNVKHFLQPPGESMPRHRSAECHDLQIKKNSVHKRTLLNVCTLSSQRNIVDFLLPSCWWRTSSFEVFQRAKRAPVSSKLNQKHRQHDIQEVFSMCVLWPNTRESAEEEPP